MYYATKRNNAKQRVIGIAGVVVGLGASAYALANGLGIIDVKERVETEVVMIEEQVEIEDEPPPPPVDVDLPPPPPQVILPDFVFETPPPQENAVQQVQQVRNPAPPPPPAPAAKPAPPPPVTVRSNPKPGRRFEKPEYPSASRRAGESGEVGVSMCVAADGRISDVKITKSSGFPRLDEATLKGLPRTRLDPAIGTDGKPMAMCPYNMTLVWDLKEGR